jgi:hypothetical protein
MPEEIDLDDVTEMPAQVALLWKNYKALKRRETGRADTFRRIRNVIVAAVCLFGLVTSAKGAWDVLQILLGY